MNVENFITSVFDKYISLKPIEVSKKEKNSIENEKYIKYKRKLLKIACKMIVIGYKKKDITNITGLSNEKIKKLESIFNNKIL